jgi:hypothetical protein
MSEFIGERIVGTWKLVSWTYQDASGNVVDFFGENPLGILTYDKSGYMSAQLMKSDRSKLGTPRLFEGTDEQVAGAYRSYAAYWGRYRETAPGEFTHYVEGSLLPDWTATEEIRHARIEGELLTLSAIVTANGHRLTVEVRWRKAN